MAMVTEDVADMIVEAAIATKGTDMWSNTMVSRPDDAVGLYQSSSFEPERAMGRIAQEPINLQVMTRAVLSVNAFNRAMSIFALLDRRKEIRGGYYYTIMARHMPHFLGVDENNRPRWSCNYKVYREVAA